VEVLEDGANDGGLGDVGQDAAATATLAAGEKVLPEGALEKESPWDASSAGGGRKLGRRSGR